MNRGSKIAISILSILLVAALALLAYTHLLRSEQARQITDLKTVQDVNGPLEAQVIHQQLALDSLELIIASQQEALNNYLIYNDSAEGVFFEVQLGKFKHFSIADYREQLIHMHEDSGEFNTILLGRFTDLSEAESLLNQVKRLGFRTAFVSGRINGRICSLDEALSFSG